MGSAAADRARITAFRAVHSNWLARLLSWVDYEAVGVSSDLNLFLLTRAAWDRGSRPKSWHPPLEGVLVFCLGPGRRRSPSGTHSTIRDRAPWVRCRGRPTHPIRHAAHSFGRPPVTPGCHIRADKAAG